MMLIPLGLDNKWKSIYKNHQYLVNAENIYYNTIRLINKHHKLLDRDGFVEYYKNILNDIELVSHPIDMFIPNDNMDEDLENAEGYAPQIMIVSRETPEYERIKKRITLDDLYAAIPSTHPVHLALVEHPEKLDVVVDDIVLYWALFKFLDMIDMIRLKDISVMTPIIEYTVEHITLGEWKAFLSESKKINEKKVGKWMDGNFFDPDMDHTIQFYQTGEHGITIDVENLLQRLCSNIIFNSDIYIIISVYLILSFAKVDILDGKLEDSKCATYVREVIAKL